jgi:hypothetical protein
MLVGLLGRNVIAVQLDSNPPQLMRRRATAAPGGGPFTVAPSEDHGLTRQGSTGCIAQAQSRGRH